MKINFANLALLKRSLMLDNRSIVTYGYRFSLLIAILLCLITFHLRYTSNAVGFAAAGLDFFSSITYINLCFITLAGFTIFANAITEEKEDKTMTLLLMTGIRPFTLLLSKAGSRFFTGATLLIAQIPFAMFAITLGGVGMNQIFSVYIALFAYLVLLCGLAIFMSTISRGSKKASTLTLLSLLVFYTLPFIIYFVCCSYISVRYSDPSVWSSQEYFFKEWALTSPFYQVARICSTKFTAAPDLIFGIQFWSNFGGGVALFCLAWVFFNRYNRTESDVDARPWFIFKRQRWLKVLAPTRAWTWNPLCWKEFFFSCGGFPIMIIKCVFYFLCFLFFSYVIRYNYQSDRHIGMAIIISAFFALWVETTYFASTLLSQERKWKTWSSLTMLPCPTPVLIYRRTIGILPAFIPLALYFLLGISFDPRYFINDFLGEFDELIFWSITLYFIFYYHLTAYVSLRIKYGSWAIAGIVCFLIFACAGSISATMMHSGEAFCAFLIIFAVSGSAYLHVQIIRRVLYLASID